MPALLRVNLTPAQDQEPFELRQTSEVPQRVKDRGEVVRLNTKK